MLELRGDFTGLDLVGLEGTVVEGPFTSLATLLLLLCLDRLELGFLGRDNLSVTAAAVARTVDLDGAEPGLVGRPEALWTGAGSTEFLDDLAPLLGAVGAGAGVLLWVEAASVSLWLSLEPLERIEEKRFAGEDLVAAVLDVLLAEIEVVLCGGGGGVSLTGLAVLPFCSESITWKTNDRTLLKATLLWKYKSKIRQLYLKGLEFSKW